MNRLTPSTAEKRSRMARVSVRRWVMERAVADPRAPQVDRLADHVDSAGQDVRRQRHRDVLVEHALGPAEAVLVPERPAEQLVPGRAVVEQRGVLGHVGAGPGGVERREDHAGLPGADRREAVEVAGGEVGAGAVERAGEHLVGGAGDDVVAVDERQVVAGGLVRPGVAGVAQAAVGLADQDEAVVVLGEGGGDGRAGVGRAVVDHDDLEVAERLLGQGLQALDEVPLDVVDGHDDADAGHAGSGLLSEERASLTSVITAPDAASGWPRGPRFG